MKVARTSYMVLTNLTATVHPFIEIVVLWIIYRPNCQQHNRKMQVLLMSIQSKAVHNIKV